MKPIYVLVFILYGVFLCSCEMPTSEEKGTPPTSALTSGTEDGAGVDTSRSVPPPQLRKEHGCTLAGKILEGNELWLKSEEVLLCVVADSSSYDNNFGESHRLLDVYDTKTCERIQRHELPVNVSPDFPYYLAEITYNHFSKIVAVRGFDKIYCYDVVGRNLLQPIEPGWLSERFDQDAQSGMITRLEVWENYLIGFARDYGTFAFDMKERNNFRPKLPDAEFELDEGVYNSMFLLQANTGAYQALIPVYDFDTGQFSVNPLFDEPKRVNPEISSRVRNNRYIILNEGGTSEPQHVAIDMLEQKAVDLPEDIRSKKTSEILKWLRNQ